MTATLTEQESLDIFYNSLCNAVGTGYMLGHGLEMNYADVDYQTAKAKLGKPCYEDVLLQILKDGHALTFTDREGEGEYTRSVTLADVYARMPKVPLENLANFQRELDDANDADIVLQTVFFEGVIFG